MVCSTFLRSFASAHPAFQLGVLATGAGTTGLQAGRPASGPSLEEKDRADDRRRAERDQDRENRVSTTPAGAAEYVAVATT